MSVLNLNEQQKEAVECLDRDLVVAAGAGSGKTAVLAHRFAHAVGGKSDQLTAGIDEILTITFTRKAAAELTERVRGVLMEGGPAGVSLARRVDEAWVSTIDSLCARLMKRHVLETGRDPGLRYASEVQAAQLRRESALHVIETRSGAGVADDVICYGMDTLVSALVQDLERLRSMGRRPSDVIVTSGQESGLMLAPVIEACTRLIEGIEDLGDSGPAARAANLVSARNLRAACEACGDFSEQSQARELLSVLMTAKFNVGTSPQDEAKEAKARAQELTNMLGDVVLAPVAEQYVALLGAYADDYDARKRAAGLMDFSDAVEGVAALFDEHPDLVKRYQKHFKLIMMDEFQDTNELQMEAIQPMRCGNLCAVGDVQQSIYGFRYADVEVMRNLEDDVGTELPLTLNYRSHPEVLHVINAVFANNALMGSRYTPLEAGRTKEYEVPWLDDEPRVEMHLLDEKQYESGTHAAEEAELVAGRIESLIEAGAEPGQIGILMQAMTHAPKVAAALSARGINTHLASGEAFFETPEVQDLKALLRVVAVPDDDTAMIRILAGPLGALPDDEILAVSQVRGQSLWQGLRSAAADSPDDHSESTSGASGIYLRISRLRELEGIVSLADLLHRAVYEFDYDLTLLASSAAGAPAWANVNKLIRMAAEYEAVASSDVAAFLGYLDDYENLVKREPVAPSTGVEGAVKIMSVHAAKGLEFPVVVLAGLGKGIASAVKGRILLERDSSGVPKLGMRWPDDGSTMKGVQDSTYELLKSARKETESEEVKRVLYVALTRAQEVLILVGQATPGKFAATGCGLIGSALGLEPDTPYANVDGVRVKVDWHVPPGGVDEEPIDPAALASEGRTSDTELWAGEIEQDAFSEGLCQPAPLSPTPPSLSYTALHVFDQCSRRFYATYVLGLTKLTYGASEALEIGAAVHLVLQTDDPLQNVERIIEASGLAQVPAARVATAVSDFVGCSVAERLEAAPQVYRERPFSIDLGRTRLEGKIDAIAHEADGVLIIDYKTGIDAEASRSPERIAAYELQASCYALAVLEGGESSVEVMFVFVEQGCETLTFEFTGDDRERIREDIVGRLDKMETGDFPWLESRDERQCSECPAQGVCPFSLG